MNILIINGPNINLLGLREPQLYGSTSYAALLERIKSHANHCGVTVTCQQSNHEGDLVDYIQAAYGVYDGIVINPAAYTHTSVALLDALKAVGIPTVEVHITNPLEREDFRHISYVGHYAEKTIRGHGLDGYIEAMDYLIERYRGC